MPAIDFLLSVDQYETKYSYRMDPLDYEMIPKVDEATREAECDLGLWNLQDVVSSEENVDTNTFAVGQNFIKKYGITMQFVERKYDSDSDKNTISLTIFIGNASHK